MRGVWEKPARPFVVGCRWRLREPPAGIFCDKKAPMRRAQGGRVNKGQAGSPRCPLTFALCGDQAFAARIWSAASLLKVTPFSSKSVSSSPESIISVMMSQPPTNSPLT
ncbi:hypothetical protein AQS8620_03065 [Aquimixticola soesokkakensis]|uniref:Uncharacterized protein n=1 Tax=Aquimixticola soesokkakensis TaxID=1519096 RepID=A0A1Y5TKI5_9RHOB|nr:hypothetical protein AQS8620_03065 [Aquimixticola soesokkakensis]